MRKTLLKIISVLLGCLVAFGIAELTVRNLSPQLTGDVAFGYHRELGAIALPNQRGRKTTPKGQSYDFTNNSYGFRGSREYGPEKGAAFRLLFLGDSFTYGLGVNDDEAFPQQVEKILRAKGYSVEIINAGSPGKGTDFELRLLQLLGPKLKPDLVVLCFFRNDFYDNAEEEYFRLGKDGELIPQKPHSLTAKKALIENLPVISWLLSWSHAANLIKVTTVNLLKPPGISLNRLRFNVNDYGYDRHFTQIFFSQIIKTVQAMGSGLLFFYLPDEQQVALYKKSGELFSYAKDFDDLVRSQKAEPYSLTPALAAFPGKIELPYWGHYTPAANLEAARYISGPIETWLNERQSHR